MDRAKEFHGEVLKLRWMKRKEKGERRGEDGVGFGFGRLTSWSEAMGAILLHLMSLRNIMLYPACQPKYLSLLPVLGYRRLKACSVFQCSIEGASASRIVETFLDRPFEQ